MHKRKVVNNIFVYIVAMLICLFSIIPILWTLSTSFKPNFLIYAQPPQWIPKQVTFQHYLDVLQNPKMLMYFLNSFIVSACSTIIALVVGILGGYGFSRYKFPGHNTMMVTILLTRLMPRVAVIVPFFVILQNIKLYNTRPGLILVYLLITMPLAIWLLKGFFDGIPYEIEEAATVDGCSVFGLLTRIVIPITLPAIGSVGMYAFITAWNEFLFALTMTSTSSMRTISVGLAYYIDETGIQWGNLMSSSVLMTIPSSIVFILFQKSLIRGLTDGGVKG